MFALGCNVKEPGPDICNMVPVNYRRCKGCVGSVLRPRARLLTRDSENQLCLFVSSWSAEEQFGSFCQIHVLISVEP